MGLIKKIFGILITIVVIIIVLSIVGGTGLFIWGNHDEKNRYIKVETNVGYLIDKNDSMSAAQYKKITLKQNLCMLELKSKQIEGQHLTEMKFMLHTDSAKKEMSV